ncbi:MAG: histidine phosphatase family protein [Bacteroidetes bacterium]|nr:histidine phosphatase family protein [Bacteroidota bacterium]
MHIYCLRHTAVKIDRHICYGQSEVLLSESYKTDLINIFQSLPTVKFSRIYSSPSGRCKKLALDLQNLINTSETMSSLYQEPIFDNRLLELDFGEWELRSWNEIAGPKVDAWMNDWIHQRAGGGSGESLLQLVDRVRSFINDLRNGIIRDSDRDNILITTHSGVIRSLYTLLNNSSLEDYFTVKPVFGGLHLFNIYN